MRANEKNPRRGSVPNGVGLPQQESDSHGLQITFLRGQDGDGRSHRYSQSQIGLSQYESVLCLLRFCYL